MSSLGTALGRGEVVRSPWPDPEIPDSDLASFVLRHAGRLAGEPRTSTAQAGGVTYGELAGGVERVAAGLAARGFGRGDVLALHLPNLPEFPSPCGGLRAGGAVSRPARSWPPRARTRARRTRARMVISVGRSPRWRGGRHAGRRQRRDRARRAVVRRADRRSRRTARVAARPHEVAVMLSSSGTTGLPKAVQLAHRALVANLVQMAVPFPIEEGERVLGIAPFFHSMGLSCVLNHALASGGTVVALARFDLEVMLRAMETHGVQQALVAPPLLAALATTERLVVRPVRAAHRRQRRGTRRRGARAGRRRAPRLPRRAGVRHHRGLSAGRRLPAPDPSLMRPGSVGLLVGGTEAKVVDPRSGATLPAGEDGELWVRGPQLMAGYRDDPDATAATIDEDGWLHTGDLGHIDEDGTVFLVDRLKELIKVRGFQVAPAELEAVLVTHPAVADAAVIGVPDERDGERPKAFVVSRGPLDHEELSAYVAERVAPYKRLGAIEEIESCRGRSRASSCAGCWSSASAKRCVNDR